MAKTPQLHCGNIGSIPIGVNINIFNISNDNRQYNFFDNTLSTPGPRGARARGSSAGALRAPAAVLLKISRLITSLSAIW